MEMYEVLEPNWQADQEWPPVGVERLRGKRVLVTGANRGFGLAIAEHLGSVGAHVLLHCRDETACVNSTAAVTSACRDGGTARCVMARGREGVRVGSGVLISIASVNGRSAKSAHASLCFLSLPPRM
jgi:hypothetical protein